jgi:hypothetical protein
MQWRQIQYLTLSKMASNTAFHSISTVASNNIFTLFLQWRQIQHFTLLLQWRQIQHFTLLIQWRQIQHFHSISTMASNKAFHSVSTISQICINFIYIHHSCFAGCRFCNKHAGRLCNYKTALQIRYDMTWYGTILYQLQPGFNPVAVVHTLAPK